MDKIYRLTKSQVINAIATEPALIAGVFHKRLIGKSHRDCPVCAVGAVLRRAQPDFGDNIYSADKVLQGGYCASSYSELDDEQFEQLTILDKISAAFEYAVEEAQNSNLVSDEQALEIGRLHAINVAEAFCPEVVEFEF